MSNPALTDDLRATAAGVAMNVAALVGGLTSVFRRALRALFGLSAAERAFCAYVEDVLRCFVTLLERIAAGEDVEDQPRAARRAPRGSARPGVERVRPSVPRLPRIRPDIGIARASTPRPPRSVPSPARGPVFVATAALPSIALRKRRSRSPKPRTRNCVLFVLI